MPAARVRLDVAPLDYAGGAVIAIGLLYPLIALAIASWTSADVRTPWDRVARTRVRYKLRSAARTVLSSK